MLISSIYGAVRYVEPKKKKRKKKGKKKRVIEGTEHLRKPSKTKVKRLKKKKTSRKKLGGDFLNGSKVVRGFR